LLLMVAGFVLVSFNFIVVDIFLLLVTPLRFCTEVVLHF